MPDPQFFYIEIVAPPQPKGSVSAFPFKKKNGKLGASVVHSKGSKDFEKRIRECVKASQFVPGATAVELWFFLQRPKTVKKPYPIAKKADIDKLTRTVLDALDEIWEDDSRVVDLIVRKRYADDCQEGVWIYVREKEDEELELEKEARNLVREQRLKGVS